MRGRKGRILERRDRRDRRDSWHRSLTSDSKVACEWKGGDDLRRDLHRPSYDYLLVQALCDNKWFE